ncbi:hypothetical protein KRX51_04180 [Corynebacterium sp. TAE3-ERU12]|uniref:hypothetical protein n=1 Tax=Corynebacterium sp. TAE3-ERU12 TaxID=2849491 RepID=UPI001C447AEF|nr:hypothetical protein [Corynebacterium sp. TAE3-ERU12]MBV7295116.1 hypothetical protein [Corynebacterium sp. TAE3-ERU12]
MPRRNRPRRRSGARSAKAPSRPLPQFGSSLSGTWVETGPGRLAQEDFHVRAITAGQATKFYRCPACDQEIPPGVAHIVAWPVDYGAGADDRRHWHRNCWQRRNRIGPAR